jgi:hypothetical protein
VMMCSSLGLGMYSSSSPPPTQHSTSQQKDIT